MVVRIRKSVALVIFIAAICCTTVFVCTRNVYTGVSAQKSISVPVIMYHQISRSEDNIGKYIIYEKELEKDLEYLKENGYETINVSDLISFIEGKAELPEKCVMLTFDDGYETAFTILYPLLKKYNMKAVVSVIGYLTELYTENEDHNDLYSYLDEEEIRILSQTDEIEIQNHSFDMHSTEQGKRKGINKLPGESFEEYKKALTDDIGKEQTEILKITGKLPEAMFYPFGECCSDTLTICKSLGFEATFTCEEKINTVTKFRKDSLYNLGRFNRSGKISSKDFFEKRFCIL